MASRTYISITGQKQGLISEGCSSKLSIGEKCQADHPDEIMVLSLSHTMSSIEQTTGAIHQPVVITKYIDKSSPLLAQALTDREIIDCEIILYRESSLGTQEKFYTIKLEGGVIAAKNLHMPNILFGDNAEMEEQIAIRYRTITWTHHKGNTTGSTSWSDSE